MVMIPDEECIKSVALYKPWNWSTAGLFGHPAGIREAYASTYATEDFVKSQSISKQIKLDGLGVTGKTSGSVAQGPCGGLYRLSQAQRRARLPKALADLHEFPGVVEQWAQQHSEGNGAGGAYPYTCGVLVF